MNTCGAWGGCILPEGHNLGYVDIPERHRVPGRVARPAREPATLGVPEWYIRTVYAESCGAPGTDEYARGVEEFQQYKRQAQADFLLAMARYMRTHWDAGGTIRDPQNPETSYSADRWIWKCALSGSETEGKL